MRYAWFAGKIVLSMLTVLPADFAPDGQLLPHPQPNVAEASLQSYLARVRAENAVPQGTEGSIWADNGRLARMMADVRAMRPNDLISVVVSENLAASTDGTVKNSRASNATSQVSSLFGLLHAGNALQNL